MATVRSSVLCQITAFSSKIALSSSTLPVAAALASLRANALVAACVSDSLIGRTPPELKLIRRVLGVTNYRTRIRRPALSSLGDDAIAQGPNLRRFNLHNITDLAKEIE